MSFKVQDLAVGYGGLITNDLFGLKFHSQLGYPVRLILTPQHNYPDLVFIIFSRYSIIAVELLGANSVEPEPWKFVNLFQNILTQHTTTVGVIPYLSESKDKAYIDVERWNSIFMYGYMRTPPIRYDLERIPES